MSKNSRVIFIDSENFKNKGKVYKALEFFGIKAFEGKQVLVKLHMGEDGNKYFLKPPVIKPFIDILKTIGAKPFVFDTAVMYAGSRHTKKEYLKTAKKHGFDKLGCPIIIGNEGNAIETDVNGRRYAFEVANELCDVECVLSIAHGKGHLMTAFGGSIKAFGMGGVSKESKEFIHGAAAPVIKDSEKCRLCGSCMEVCPRAAIKVGDSWTIDYTKCNGCERCVRTCPYNVLEWKEEEFDLMLAAAAHACLNEFGPKNRPKKKIFFNILIDISKRCDCAVHAGPVIAPDIGMVVSDDPVAADAASIDLIEKAIGKSLKDVQGADPRLHVKYAEQLGMGSMDYELVKV